MVGQGAGCLSRGGARDGLQELIGLPISLQWSTKVNVQVKEMSIQKRIPYVTSRKFMKTAV